MIITGRVIKGDQRGRKQKFPTANLNFHLVLNKISKGVYACQIKMDGKIYPGVLVYGVPDRKQKPKLEIYFLNLHQNLYGKLIAVKVIKKIRPLKRFKSKEEFIKQAKKDVKAVKNVLKTLENIFDFC